MTFAATLAAMPDLLHRALAEHVPDATGRCRECRTTGGRGAEWPCAMRLIAEEAGGMSHGTWTATANEVGGMRRRHRYR